MGCQNDAEQGEEKGAAMHIIMLSSLCGVYFSQVMRKFFKAPCHANMSKSKHHLVHPQRGRHPIYNIPVDYKHKLKVGTFTEVKEAIKARRAVAEQFPLVETSAKQSKPELLLPPQAPKTCRSVSLILMSSRAQKYANMKII